MYNVEILKLFCSEQSLLAVVRLLTPKHAKSIHEELGNNVRELMWTITRLLTDLLLYYTSRYIAQLYCFLQTWILSNNLVLNFFSSWLCLLCFLHFQYGQLFRNILEVDRQLKYWYIFCVLTKSLIIINFQLNVVLCRIASLEIGHYFEWCWRDRPN